MRVFLALLLLAGCAAHSARSGAVVAMQDVKDPNADSGTGPKGHYTCAMERSTGTNLSKKVCRYDEDDQQSALHRQMTQDAIDQTALTGTPMK
jgi:hypothetical protein